MANIEHCSQSAMNYKPDTLIKARHLLSSDNIHCRHRTIKIDLIIRIVIHKTVDKIKFNICFQWVYFLWACSFHVPRESCVIYVNCKLILNRENIILRLCLYPLCGLKWKIFSLLLVSWCEFNLLHSCTNVGNNCVSICMHFF